MDETQYPSNSHKSKSQATENTKREAPRVEKVVSGSVTRKTETLGTKVKKTFIAEDMRNVADYIIHNVLIPNLKHGIDDGVSNGVHMLLFGSVTRSDSRRNVRGAIRSYDSYYSSKRDQQVISNTPRRAGVFNSSDYTFEDRVDAERILDVLQDLIYHYGVARVRDFYEAAGITNMDWTTEDFGWRSLDRAYVEPDGEAWIVNLPRPIEV